MYRSHFRPFCIENYSLTKEKVLFFKKNYVSFRNVLLLRHVGLIKSKVYIALACYCHLMVDSRSYIDIKIGIILQNVFEAFKKLLVFRHYYEI